MLVIIPVLNIPVLNEEATSDDYLFTRLQAAHITIAGLSYLLERRSLRWSQPLPDFWVQSMAQRKKLFRSIGGSWSVRESDRDGTSKHYMAGGPQPALLSAFCEELYVKIL